MTGYSKTCTGLPGTGAGSSARRALLFVALVLSLAATLALYQKLLNARQALTQLTPHTIDIRFSQFMSLHHQQAIALSQIMLDGRPTGLAPLARSIANAQLLELGEMRGWLRLWDQPLQPDSDDMTWMLLGQQPYDQALLQYLIDCGNAPKGMPGLATPEQVSQLQAMDGRARDEQFLRLMLAHHEGGLPMARFAAREAALLPVRTLAGRVLLEQAKEIKQLQSMLALAQSAAGRFPQTHTGRQR